MGHHAQVQLIRHFLADIDRPDHEGEPDWDALIQPTRRLCEWVQGIAAIRLDGEEPGTGEPFIVENDDAWSTVRGLVNDARGLVGASESGPVTKVYNRDAISDALNRAAEQVLDRIGNGEWSTDLINLLVNASLHYLDNPGDDLAAAIDANYDEDANTVLGWIGES
jgi:hypothetical protein